MKIIGSTFLHKIKHAAKAIRKPLCNFAIPNDIVELSQNIKPLKQTKNPSEIKKLVRLFFDSSEHSINNGVIGSQSKIKDFFHRMNRRFHSIPCEFFARDADAATAVIKNRNNKIVGGYSMYKEPRTCKADLGIFVISPELKNTRTSKQMLMSMVESIYKKAVANNIIHIECVVHKDNKSANKLLSKLKPRILSEGTNIEYSISVKNLKTFMDKYSNLMS